MAAPGILRRAAWAGVASLALIGLAGCDLLDDTTSMVVSTTVDGADADPGDGVCEMTAATGDCSLRAAVDEANANVLMALITVPAGTYVLDTGGTEDANASGDLDVDPASGHLVISAPARGAVVDAAGGDGGIDIRSGNVVTAGVSVTGSAADGFVARSGAMLSVLQGSPNGNIGAGVAFDAGSSGQVLGSTSSGNGAGIDNEGSVSVRFATITANAGPGLTGSGATTVAASVVVNQSSGPDCAAPVTSEGSNAFGEVGCGVGPSDTLTTDLVLSAELVDGVPGFVPGGGSFDVRDAIAVGEGGCGDPNADQAGVARPVGSACDKGALETEAPAIDLVVDSAVDAVDADPTDGVCDDGSGVCTLRAAIEEANVQGGATATHFDPVTITIATGVDPVISLPPSDPGSWNTTDPLVIAGGVTIEGNGSTIDLVTNDRAFEVVHHHARFHDVTIRGGDSVTDGVITNIAVGATGASIELDHVSMIDNEYSNAVQMTGGAFSMVDSEIVNAYDGVEGTMDSVLLERSVITSTEIPLDVTAPQIVLRDSTFDGEYYVHLEGDVLIEGSTFAWLGLLSVDGTLTMRNSTVTNGLSGGLFLVGTGTVVGSTLVDNDLFLAGDVPDIWVSDGSLTVSASIIGGSGYPACRLSNEWTGGVGTITSGGYNLVTDSSCGFTATGDQQGVAPLLAPRADNGGATQTRLPQPGSPAIDSIPAGSAGLCDGTLATDQRGVARPQGAACDSGAVEVEIAPIELVVTSALDAVDADPTDGVCDDGTGACTLRAAVDEANVQGGANATDFTPVTIVIAAGIDPVLSLPPADPSETDADPLVINGGVTIEGGGATIDLANRDRHIHVLHHGLTLRDLTITGSDTTSEPMIRTDVPGATGPSIELDQVDLTEVGSGGIAMSGGDLVVADATVIGSISSTGTGISGAVDSVLIERTTMAQNDYSLTVAAADIVIRDSQFTGGYYVDLDGGAVLVERSTVAYTGSVSISGDLTMRNSTVVHNDGGLYLDGTATITGSTIADNSLYGVEYATDIHIGAGSTVSIGATIVGGAGYPACTVLAGGTLTSLGYNVVTDSTCAPTGPGDQHGVDPLLAALGDNGGPTSTRLPQPGSPAIDTIATGTAGLCDGTLSPDQRGVARPQGGACDAGSVEVPGPPI